jgi:hypothetical protein
MTNPAALITALILDHPLCIDCLATKSGLSDAELETAVTRIAQSLVLRRRPDRCRACGETAATFTLEQSA